MPAGLFLCEGKSQAHDAAAGLRAAQVLMACSIVGFWVDLRRAICSLIQPLLLVLELHGDVLAGEVFEVLGDHGFDLHLEAVV